MAWRAPSGSVSVPSRQLGRLIDVARKGVISDLGDLQQGVEGYLVDAMRLSEFLEEFHDDAQLIELSGGGYQAVVDAVARQGYPLRRSDYPTAEGLTTGL